VDEEAPEARESVEHSRERAAATGEATCELPLEDVRLCPDEDNLRKPASGSRLVVP